MKNCPQTDNQSVYDHCQSVKIFTLELISILNGAKVSNQWKIPSWLFLYKQELLNNLLTIDIISEYTEFHDVGKPQCFTLDENNKRHFPNHSELSGKIWFEATGNVQVSKLISMDMLIHKLKACDIDNFIKNKECITLLIVGLAEIHANCIAFGGLDSLSFKIKYKKINSNGSNICKKLFGEK